MPETDAVEIEVDLFDEIYDAGAAPETVVAFMAWLEGLIKKIPPEHREAATINFWSDGDYGRENARLEITYFRPETAEEKAVRRAEERAERRRLREAEDASDRREYERLKAKFEGPADA